MHGTDVVITAEHRELLDELMDKWSLQVLDQLCEHGALRFNELRRAIPSVSQKSLTAALRRLERNGMVERSVVSDRPLAVAYRISTVGHSIQQVIDALFLWTTAHLSEVRNARAEFDAELDS